MARPCVSLERNGALKDIYVTSGALLLADVSGDGNVANLATRIFLIKLLSLV